MIPFACALGWLFPNHSCKFLLFVMPIPPLDLIVELLISIILPGFVCAALIGIIFLRWKLAGLALIAGIIAANYRGLALPWFEWDRELGRILIVMLLSLVTMSLNSENPWQRLAGMVWVGLCSAVLFFHDDIPLSHLIAGSAVSTLVYAAVLLAEQQLPAWNLLALLLLTGFSTATVMIHAHTARLCDVGLMWAFSCAGLLCASLFWKKQVCGTAGLAAALFPFLLYYGQQSTESQVPMVSFALVVAAPISGFLTLLKMNNRRLWFVNILWLICLALAVGLAMRYETVVIE